MNQVQAPKGVKTTNVISAPTVVPSIQSNKGKIYNNNI